MRRRRCYAARSAPPGWWRRAVPFRSSWRMLSFRTDALTTAFVIASSLIAGQDVEGEIEVEILRYPAPGRRVADFRTARSRRRLERRAVRRRHCRAPSPCRRCRCARSGPACRRRRQLEGRSSALSSPPSADKRRRCRATARGRCRAADPGFRLSAPSSSVKTSLPGLPGGLRPSPAPAGRRRPWRGPPRPGSRTCSLCRAGATP